MSDTHQGELEALRTYLRGRPSGPIAEWGELLTVLCPAWPDFAGSDEEAMDSAKLDRMEDPRWEPPVLSFNIERHGAFCCGSSRAEMQTWSVDVDRTEADCQMTGYRQVGPMSPRLDVKPIAAEIVSLIERGADDDRLKWSPDRSRVKVTVRRVIPSILSPKQTVEGRRNRFTKALDEAMASAGWEEVAGTSPYTYERIQP
jgi:hypothetical protein